MSTNDKVTMLLFRGKMSSAELRAEVTDAQWSDFGRRVHDNLMHDNMMRAFNMASLKTSNTRELTQMIRAYLLTGTLP